MHKWACENMQQTRDAHHKLTLGLPHYTCGVVTGPVGVATGPVAVGSCFAPD